MLLAHGLGDGPLCLYQSLILLKVDTEPYCFALLCLAYLMSSKLLEASILRAEILNLCSKKTDYCYMCLPFNPEEKRKIKDYEYNRLCASIRDLSRNDCQEILCKIIRYQAVDPYDSSIWGTAIGDSEYYYGEACQQAFEEASVESLLEMLGKIKEDPYWMYDPSEAEA